MTTSSKFHLSDWHPGATVHIYTTVNFCSPSNDQVTKTLSGNSVHVGHNTRFSVAHGNTEVGVKLTGVSVQEAGWKTSGRWFYLSPQGAPSSSRHWWLSQAAPQIFCSQIGLAVCHSPWPAARSTWFSGWGSGCTWSICILVSPLSDCSFGWDMKYAHMRCYCLLECGGETGPNLTQHRFMRFLAFSTYVILL